MGGIDTEREVFGDGICFGIGGAFFDGFAFLINGAFRGGGRDGFEFIAGKDFFRGGGFEGRRGGVLGGGLAFFTGRDWFCGGGFRVGGIAERVRFPTFGDGVCFGNGGHVGWDFNSSASFFTGLDILIGGGAFRFGGGRLVGFCFRLGGFGFANSLLVSKSSSSASARFFLRFDRGLRLPFFITGFLT